MNKFISPLFSLILIVVTVSCSKKQFAQVVKIEDNPIIEQLFLKDIEIRELDVKTDTVILENYDKIHRNKIFEMLANNLVKTPIDKFRAALILQHTAGKICEGQLTSISPENFLLAYHLSSNALSELEKQQDSVTIKKENFPGMIALNYDRYLLFSFGYQKFGTQFVFDDKTGEMLLAPVDTTLSNDIERKRHNVASLNQLLSKYKMKPMPAE